MAAVRKREKNIGGESEYQNGWQRNLLEERLLLNSPAPPFCQRTTSDGSRRPADEPNVGSPHPSKAITPHP